MGNETLEHVGTDGKI